jgi:hypothetical protein
VVCKTWCAEDQAEYAGRSQCGGGGDDGG